MNCTDVFERLRGRNKVRERRLFLQAVDVLDDGPLAGNTIDWMEDSEATARSEKCGQRLREHLKDEIPLSIS